MCTCTNFLTFFSLFLSLSHTHMNAHTNAHVKAVGGVLVVLVLGNSAIATAQLLPHLLEYK